MVWFSVESFIYPFLSVNLFTLACLLALTDSLTDALTKDTDVVHTADLVREYRYDLERAKHQVTVPNILIAG